MKKYIVDIGSSTIKTYIYNGKTLVLSSQKTVHFKKNLKQGTIADQDKKTLIEYLKNIKVKSQEIKIIATAVFRKLDLEKREELISYVFENTGYIINIIDQETESIFLQIALIRNMHLSQKVLIINIGGGSTELVVLKKGKKIETNNIDIGVVDIFEKYKGINDNYSKFELDKIVYSLVKKLPRLSNKVNFAFQTGGELKYMQVAKYPLIKNNLFKDENHPSVIKMQKYNKRNKDIFEKVKLSELESLMPENPEWMHGARAYCAIAQAICLKNNIKIIIPSDVNIAHGIAHYEWDY